MVRQGALQFSGLTRHIGSLLTNSGPCYSYTIGVPDFLLQKNVGVYTIPLHVLTIVIYWSIFKTIQVILCTCYN